MTDLVELSDIVMSLEHAATKPVLTSISVRSLRTLVDNTCDTHENREKITFMLAPSDDDTDDTTFRKNRVINVIGSYSTHSTISLYIAYAVGLEKYDLAAMYYRASSLKQISPDKMTGSRDKWMIFFTKHCLALAPDSICREILLNNNYSLQAKYDELEKKNQQLSVDYRSPIAEAQYKEMEKKLSDQESIKKSMRAKIVELQDKLNESRQSNADLVAENEKIKKETTEAKLALENISKALGFLTKQ